MCRVEAGAYLARRLLASRSMLWIFCLDGCPYLHVSKYLSVYFHYSQTLLNHKIIQCTAIAAKVNNCFFCFGIRFSGSRHFQGDV